MTNPKNSLGQSIPIEFALMKRFKLDIADITKRYQKFWMNMFITSFS